MSNKLAKMAKSQTAKYDFSKGGKVYGRTERTMTVQEAADETWKIAYRVLMEVVLETLENDFEWGEYMRNEFVKEFTKNHERIASTGEQARECLRRCEDRPETEQLFEK